ncbi:hypothetical protein G9A89_002721 [Geosiphon pyriformis]|nr:hypothetical protein G9A89_002721 [Geosiphon pyriformis]
MPDFHSFCWLERCRIFDLVCKKDLSVYWVKVKEHSGVVGNVKADAAIRDAVFSRLSLPIGVQECFLVAENTPVSGNTCHFVWDLYKSVCRVQWEAGLGHDVIPGVLIKTMDWDATVKMWHPDSHMLAGFTIRKRLYDNLYPGVLCLLCHEMELPDHVFTCSHDMEVCKEVLVTVCSDWLSIVGLCGLSFFAVLQSLSQCSLDIGLYLVLCKEFVLREWCEEAVGILNGKKKTVGAVVGFVERLVELHHSKAWLVRSAFRVKMEKTGLVGDDGLFSGLSYCLDSLLPDKVVRMLSIASSFAVNFGHHRSYLFFSGLDSSPSVDIVFTDRIAFLFPFSLFYFSYFSQYAPFCCHRTSGSESTGVYFRGPSYKELRKSEVAGRVVDLSAGLLPAALLHLGDEECKISWRSEVENDESSMSEVLDVENMANTIAKETSYTESGEDNEINETTPRKTRTHTYVLDKPPKAPTFDSMSDDENALSLLSPKMFNGSNQIPSVKSPYFNQKIFYKINGFGGASTPSKFPGVVCLTFTSEFSLIKAREMTIREKIVVNGDLKKANICSNWEVIIKKIPVDLPKVAVESVFSKFGKIVSIRIQLIGLWQKTQIEFESSEVANLVTFKWSVLVKKDSVCIALVVSDKQTWCAIICFENDAARLAAIYIIPIFKSVSLRWASLVLASCAKCEQFGHITVNCSVSRSSGVHEKIVVFDHDQVRLAGIYKKKSAPIVCSVLFGGKTWAQVANGTPSRAFPSGFSGFGLHSGSVPSLAVSDPLVVSHLGDHLVVLKCSLELLADCVSGILVRLDSFDMIPSVLSSLAFSPVVFTALGSVVDSDMIVDNALGFFDITSPVTDNAVVNLSTSSSKVLTAKVGSLETKLVTLEASVGSVLDKLNFLCSGSGMNNCAKQTDIVHWHKDMNNLVRPWIADRFDGVCVFTSGLDFSHMGSGVAIILNSLLARHVCKVSEMPGQLLSVRLFFKNKLSVSILGLYAGVSLVVCFSQAGDINSFITKAVNKSSFVIFGGDFNKDSSHKCASFKKCFDLGLVNFLGGSLFVKSLTWCNSCGAAKTIDYVFVSSNLINTVVDHSVAGVNDFFDTDHRAISVSVGIGGLLDLEFKDTSAVNASMFSDVFGAAVKFSNMDAMWNIVRKIIILSADSTFKRKWFKGFDGIFTKMSFKFHKLELLVSKLVKASHSVFSEKLDSPGASVVRFLFLLGSGFDLIHSALAKVRKLYYASKLLESKRAEESSIKQAISKRMESFELDKSHTIRSVLEHPFHKVVLDHLVMEDELILESDSVKSKVDDIMEG